MLTDHEPYFARSLECAQAAVKVRGPLRDFYLRVKRTKGDAKAIVGVAHRVLRIMHAMIVHGRDCDHALDSNARKKALEMRRKAQQARRPSAVAMTVAQISSEMLERIRQEGSVG